VTRPTYISTRQQLVQKAYTLKKSKGYPAPGEKSHRSRFTQKRISQAKAPDSERNRLIEQIPTHCPLEGKVGLSASSSSSQLLAGAMNTPDKPSGFHISTAPERNAEEK